MVTDADMVDIHNFLTQKGIVAGIIFGPPSPPNGDLPVYNFSLGYLYSLKLIEYCRVKAIQYEQSLVSVASQGGTPVGTPERPDYMG